MRLLLGLLFFIMLFSCKKKNNNQTEGFKETVYAFSEIDGYPEGFTGCGCAFSVSEDAFKKQKFIYLDKYGMVDENKNFKCISLNGKQIRWNALNPPENFTLSLVYDESEKKDQDVIFKRGKLFIKFDNGIKLETPIVGYCGC